MSGGTPAGDALAMLRDRMPARPDCAVVLGSGLGGLEAHVESAVVVPYSDIPGLPSATVSGHRGAFIFGRMRGADVLLIAGRLHLYEGHTGDAVVAPVRLACQLGARHLLLTNAAGGIHPGFEPGDIVRIDDQLNLTFRSPLAGPVLEGEHRFPDMSAPFDPGLARIIDDAASRLHMKLQAGTYAGVLGPEYETAAQVRMLARLGADLVGMSTVPEVLVARAAGVPVGALSLVTNKATGIGSERLSHREVLDAGQEASTRVVALVTGVVGALSGLSRGGRND